MAPPWSPSETTALLRAWREDVETPVPLLLYHQQQVRSIATGTATTSTSTLYERFVGLCGKTQRSEASVLGRRDAFKAMWALISAFNREQQQQHTDPKEQQRLWFALPEWEKRLVFAKKSDGKSHIMLNVGRVTFAELDKIMAIKRRQVEKEKQRVEVESQERSTQLLRASALAAIHGADEVVEKRAKKGEDIIISHQDTGAAEDSGSSTESDNEIVILEEVPIMQYRPGGDTTNHQSSAASSPPERREYYQSGRTSSSTATISGREDNGWHPIITQKNKRIKLSGFGSDTTESENQSTQKPKANEMSSSSEPTSNPTPVMASSTDGSESRLQRLFSSSPPPVQRPLAPRSTPAQPVNYNESQLQRLFLASPSTPPVRSLSSPRSSPASTANYRGSRLQRLYSSPLLPSPPPVNNPPAVRESGKGSPTPPLPAPAQPANYSKSQLQKLFASSSSTLPSAIDDPSPLPPAAAKSPPALRSSPAPTANYSKSRLQKLFASSPLSPPPPIGNAPAVCEPVEDSPAVREPVGDASAMPLWLTLKPKPDGASCNPVVQKLISTLLDKHANIPHHRQYHRRQPTSTPKRKNDLGVSEVADILNAQSHQLSRVFYDFQVLQQADAEQRNQFLEDVQRDIEEKKRFREEVGRLEARIQREQHEWTQEREQLRAKRSRS